MKKYGTLYWMIYGAAIALIISTVYMVVIPNDMKRYMPVRVEKLDKLIHMDFEEMIKGSYVITDHNAVYFLYLRYLAKILGLTSAAETFYFIIILANAVILCVYPVLFYKIFDSNKVVAFVSPFFYVVNFFIDMFYERWDSYWTHEWVIALGFPLLFLFLKHLGEKISWGILAAFSLVIGWGMFQENMLL